MPVFINYENWLEVTFYLNGESFSNLKYWQNMSLKKWLRLLDVYNRISEKMNEKYKENK